MESNIPCNSCTKVRRYSWLHHVTHQPERHPRVPVTRSDSVADGGQGQPSRRPFTRFLWTMNSLLCRVSKGTPFKDDLQEARQGWLKKECEMNDVGMEAKNET
ncbi:hypothetical protein E2C01_100398 [Portunus trituberculatus]|uniref:Uncharacterized protein n=1 Tax=Portunus trituberculatus TaxID=210409 RepID=A0A5B7KJD3_PORTR|nr:hypothetical protein [Portunus trituberculatus]